jgi:DNA-binding GntR family transcriptional regulator
MAVEPHRQPAPYTRIVEHFRERIESGDLAAGDRLPPVRDIAATWGVARQTADKALARLQAEGLIRTSGRGGTIVEERVVAPRVSVSDDGMLLAVVGLPGADRLVVESAEVIPASEDVARSLGLSAGALAVVVRLRSSAGA